MEDKYFAQALLFAFGLLLATFPLSSDCPSPGAKLATAFGVLCMLPGFISVAVKAVLG